MAEYQVVAQGNSFDSITPLVGDFQLKRGDQVLVQIDTNVPLIGNAFNLAGAEQLFASKAPPSMFIVDCYGSGSTGYILMQATSPPLLAVLATLPAWAQITLTILGILIVIGVVAVLITVFVKVGTAIAETPNWLVAGLVIGGVALVGVAVYKGVSSGKVQYQLKRGETYIRTAS